MEKRAFFINDMKYDHLHYFVLNKETSFYEMAGNADIAYPEAVVIEDNNFIIFEIPEDKEEDVVAYINKENDFLYKEEKDEA